jgi:CBS domain-containing protein
MAGEFYKTKLKEIMIPSHDTPFLEESAICAEFLTKLSSRAHAWVVTSAEEMKVVGIVTEHDMLRHLAPPREKKERAFGLQRADILHRESTVQDIMTHNPVVCSPEETVADALKKFSCFNIRRLAVVDENRRLLGEVTIQLLVKNLKYRLTNTE